jgi:aldehyde dehydrogenase (NAD+)
MVSRNQWDRVQSYICIGEEEGARLLAGGPGRPQGLDRGWFVRPTIFADVRNDMRIAREEIFGPVLCIVAFRDDDDAVAIANDSPYGLQGYVFGRDLARARGVAERIEAGRVVVNNTPHEPLAPFGGVKLSGLGREFGVFGLEAFLEPRAVLI